MGAICQQFKSENLTESVEARRIRLEKAADTYRHGMVSDISSVSRNPEEELEIMRIVTERNLADKIKEASKLAKETERMIKTGNINSVLESFVDSLSDESKTRLKTILSK